jgi:3-methyladenine DNA glycosylase AlkD
MKKLEASGEARVRTLSIRAGAGDQQFGVALGDIRKLAKEIRTNHALGLELWETGNTDARLLAILILKAKQLTTDELDRMVRSITNAQEAEWFSSYVIKPHPAADSLREVWMESDHPWAARAGWGLTAGRVARRPEGLDIVALLDRIEREMAGAHTAPQWTMNSCLAQIGISFPEHRQRAIAIGEALGVFRDYPVSKGCTPPFAPIWIGEMVRRQS